VPADSTYSQVTALVSNTVVEVTTETVTTGSYFGQYVTEGAGSGVIIDPTGYIVTCAHVIDGTSKIKIKLNDGTNYDAKLIGKDLESDIAVVKIDGKDLPYASFGDSEKLIVGEEVVAIGNPLGELGGTVTNGIISALDREVEIDSQMYNLLQTNAAINPGNSGGGLFDMQGNLIGVVNAKSSGEYIEGLGFAIPSNDALSIVTELIEKGYVGGRVKLGFLLAQVADDYTAHYYNLTNYFSGYGIYIIESESKDFSLGDRMIAIDNITVSNLTDIKKVLKNYSVGDTVTVTVARINKDGMSQKHDIQLILAEKTAED